VLTVLQKMNTKQMLRILAVATGWGVLGLAIFDAFEIEYFDNPERHTRWGMLTTPQILFSVIGASCLFWVIASYLAEASPRFIFTLAAILSPVIGAFGYGTIFSLLTFNLQDIYLHVFSALIFLVGLFFISWPISVGAAISCFKITNYQR